MIPEEATRRVATPVQITLDDSLSLTEHDRLVDAVAELVAVEADQERLLKELLALVTLFTEEMFALYDRDADDPLAQDDGSTRGALRRSVRQTRRHAKEIPREVSARPRRAAELRQRVESLVAESDAAAPGRDGAAP